MATTSLQGTEIVVLLDTTGSMYSHIDRAKRSVGLLTKTLLAQGAGIGMVAYKDYGDADRHQVLSITRNHALLSAHLDTLEASGGGDMPEDIWGAVQKGLPLFSRAARTKMLVLVADAPPHQSGCMGDSFPNDSDFISHGVKLPGDLAKEVNASRVAFVVLKLNKELDSWVSIITESTHNTHLQTVLVNDLQGPQAWKFAFALTSQAAMLSNGDSSSSSLMEMKTLVDTDPASVLTSLFCSLENEDIWEQAWPVLLEKHPLQIVRLILLLRDKHGRYKKRELARRLWLRFHKDRPDLAKQCLLDLVEVGYVKDLVELLKLRGHKAVEQHAPELLCLASLMSHGFSTLQSEPRYAKVMAQDRRFEEVQQHLCDFELEPPQRPVTTPLHFIAKWAPRQKSRLASKTVKSPTQILMQKYGCAQESKAVVKGMKLPGAGAEQELVRQVHAHVAKVLFPAPPLREAQRLLVCRFPKDIVNTVLSYYGKQQAHPESRKLMRKLVGLLSSVSTAPIETAMCAGEWDAVANQYEKTPACAQNRYKELARRRFPQVLQKAAEERKLKASTLKAEEMVNRAITEHFCTELHEPDQLMEKVSEAQWVEVMRLEQAACASEKAAAGGTTLVVVDMGHGMVLGKDMPLSSAFTRMLCTPGQHLLWSDKPVPYTVPEVASSTMKQTVADVLRHMSSTQCSVSELMKTINASPHKYSTVFIMSCRAPQGDSVWQEFSSGPHDRLVWWDMAIEDVWGRKRNGQVCVPHDRFFLVQGQSSMLQQMLSSVETPATYIARVLEEKYPLKHVVVVPSALVARSALSTAALSPILSRRWKTRQEKKKALSNQEKEKAKRMALFAALRATARSTRRPRFRPPSFFKSASPRRTVSWVTSAYLDRDLRMRARKQSHSYADADSSATAYAGRRKHGRNPRHSVIKRGAATASYKGVAVMMPTADGYYASGEIFSFNKKGRWTVLEKLLGALQTGRVLHKKLPAREELKGKRLWLPADLVLCEDTDVSAASTSPSSPVLPSEDHHKDTKCSERARVRRQQRRFAEEKKEKAHVSSTQGQQNKKCRCKRKGAQCKHCRIPPSDTLNDKSAEELQQMECIQLLTAPSKSKATRRKKERDARKAESDSKKRGGNGGGGVGAAAAKKKGGKGSRRNLQAYL